MFLLLCTQLGLVLGALWRFKIEESFGLSSLLPLILGGFAVNYWLPQKYRQTFFVALSIAAIFTILPFPHSAAVIAIGIVLIATCHLPISLRARAALIIVVGLALAATRGGFAGETLNDFQGLVIPVVAAMFMFRLAIYLHDLSHEKTPATWSERLGYFFLLPNVCFLLFPVLDYQTYRRTYYDTEEHAIYQKGLLWMTRGLIHLLAYRIVYQFFVPTPGDVESLATVVQFMVTSYLIYLRISGQFHMIIGILCLFGFNLPETHHLYFLSSSFNDYWRRINIYWKDFMMKMIYYPVFVPSRKRFGMSGGIVIAAVVVFASTWLLHSYQWFWLHGAFPINSKDGLFWGFLGSMVVMNSLREINRRKGPTRNLNLIGVFRQSATTVGFFALMSALWSLWSSASIEAWWNTVSAAASSSATEVGQVAGVVALLISVGAGARYTASRWKAIPLDGRNVRQVAGPLYVAGLAGLLILVSVPYARIVLGGEAGQVVSTLRQERLNRQDQEAADRGYYEGLLNEGSFVSALWSARMGRPGDPDDVVPIQEARIVTRRDDLLEYELKRAYSGTFKAAPFRTNRWGMRSGEVDRAKPGDIYRIAFIGASYEMAGGVENDESFPALLEQRLNADESDGAFASFQVLNLSVAGYSMIHKAMVGDEHVEEFAPDLVIQTVYSSEERRLLNHLIRAVEQELPIPFPELQESVRRSGARSWMRTQEIASRLEPHVYDVIEWSFGKLKQDAQESGIPLVLLFVPATTDEDDVAALTKMEELWRRAVNVGIEPARLGDVYGGYEAAEIRLAAWDSHPNILGHRLLADAVYRFLRDREPQIASAFGDRDAVVESR